MFVYIKNGVKTIRKFACKAYNHIVLYFTDINSLPFKTALLAYSLSRSKSHRQYNTALAFNIALAAKRYDLIKAIVETDKDPENDNWNWALTKGALACDTIVIDIVAKAAGSKARIDRALANICTKGDMKVAQYVIDNYDIPVTAWNWVLAAATKSGNLDLVQFIVSKGGKNYNLALMDACRLEHWPVCEYLIKMGATKCKNCDFSTVSEDPDKIDKIVADHYTRGTKLVTLMKNAHLYDIFEMEQR